MTLFQPGSPIYGDVSNLSNGSRRHEIEFKQDAYGKSKIQSNSQTMDLHLLPAMQVLSILGIQLNGCKYCVVTVNILFSDPPH